jgi:hypothetical protein
VTPVAETGSVYWREMARRLLAFALAFVILGGPLAGDVCRAVCAEHAGHSSDPTVPPPHHDHADAAPAPSTHSARLIALAHGCGHSDAIISQSRELTRTPIAAAVVTLARITPPAVYVLPTSQIDSRHGPPTPIRSTSPLRI